MCPVGFIGATCADTDPCVPNPCMNGGLCEVETTDSSPSFRCLCKDGYSGATCSDAQAPAAGASTQNKDRTYDIVLASCITGAVIFVLSVMAVFRCHQKIKHDGDRTRIISKNGKSTISIDDDHSTIGTTFTGTIGTIWSPYYSSDIQSYKQSTTRRPNKLAYMVDAADTDGVYY